MDLWLSRFGSAGGTQELINEVPGLRWFRINVPAGAFSGQTRINSYLSSKLENAPLYFTALSPLVEIRPKDLTTNEDISVLLPYEDENQDGIIDGTDIPETEIHPGYYSEENSCWGPLEPLVPDPTANVAAMYTNHLDPFMLWGMSKDTTPNPKTQDSQKTSR